MRTREQNVRIALLVLGVPNLFAGLWIRLAPHNFWANFPGFGHHWVSAAGPYDGHTITDYGAALAGLSAGLIALALFPRARAATILLGAWLVAAIPHLLYHVVATGGMSTGDNIANIAVLALTVALPAALLVYEHRSNATPMPKATGTSDNARIALAPERGVIRRMSYRASRKELGFVTTPIAVTAHHPGLLAGYGAFELATMKATRVDARFKHLAELRTAMLVGCEYCVDIGSSISRKGGISDDEMRGLIDWRASPRFSDADRAVLEYAEAMTRTPAEISDELFDRLRALFDEAQLVELTAAIGIENYRARFNWAFGIGSDGFSEGAYCVPPDPVVAAAVQ
jgi:4-carboxymuconolactone decarboxylase